MAGCCGTRETWSGWNAAGCRLLTCSPRARPGPRSPASWASQRRRTFIAGRAEAGSRRTRRRLARYRTGCEGRISHLKRGYHLRRSRLKGDQGQRIWTGWAILAYNLDTLAIHTT
jgi:hypothetical protein